MTEVHPEGGHQSQLQRLLYSSEFLDTTSMGIMLHGADGRVLDCNRVAIELLGDPIDELVGRTLTDPQWGAVREDGSTFPADGLPVMVTLHSGELCCDVIVGIDNPGMARRWLSVSSSPVTLDDGARGVVSSFIDASERIQKDQSLKLLTEVNRVAMLASDEAEFLQQLCNVLVDQGRYALAWIGAISSSEEGGVDIACAAGATDYLYDGMVSWWGTKESGLGPTGTALRTESSQVVSDLASNARYALWRERAAQFGLGSCVALPFRISEKRLVLTIYDGHIVAFDETAVMGLEAITREIEFGAAHLRSVQQTKVALEEIIVSNDVQKVTERARAEAEQRFRLAFEDNMAPMFFHDLEGGIIAVNDAFCQLIGRSREEILEHDWKLFIHPEDVSVTEEVHQRLTSSEVDQVRAVRRFLHQDGRVIFVEVSEYPARDAEGKIIYFVVSQRDITEERELTEQLSHQALHDPLTGLANRTLFGDRLVQAHARVVRQGGLAAVLMLDLDDFKGVNDTFGHLVGDQLLVTIARRLERVTRSSDTLCRFGGDEFLYLAEGLNSTAEAERVAERLLNAFSEPFSIAEAHLEQHTSIGVVVWDEGSMGFTELIQDADVAMYEAKRQGKGRHVVFAPSMHQQAVSRFALLQELRHALQTGELSMHYQPIVDLTTTAVVGFEALMRWQHPQRGWVPPNVFIPLAEQSDFILELGSFALREAVAAASTWEWTGDQAGRPYVTVNLSAHQFHDPGLISMVEDALRTSGLAPERLIIEITESVTLLDVAETMSVMEHLNRLGIGIALDDFGTGYSSLSYLALLHPRIIKIDQSFVSPAHEGARNDMLLETIVSLGNKLDMTMLAEGIETHAQLERLRNLGCELGQGYLFSPAVPAGEVAAMLDRVSGDQGVRSVTWAR
jgi:diguanylate cyclase (GGDEF)-like protein/PAS domain S-box-containing protein